MDIHVGNIPPQATNTQLRDFLRSSLEAHGILTFHVNKLRTKPTAFLTVLDPDAGQAFLKKHGVASGSPRHVTAQFGLRWNDRTVRFSVARNQPSELLLRSLRHEATQPKRQATTKHDVKQNQKATPFEITALACGVWDYDHSTSHSVDESVPQSQATNSRNQLIFLSHFHDTRSGTVTFGRKRVMILLGDEMSPQTRVDILYRDCHDIVIDSGKEDLSLSLTLQIPPKISEVNAMASLSLRVSTTTRLPAINNRHAEVAGSCFVYRIIFRTSRDIEHASRLIRGNNAMPSITLMKTRFQPAPRPRREGFILLTHELSDTARFGSKAFELRFQAERLARNGLLSPEMVISLLPKINELQSIFGLERTLRAIRRFCERVPYAGPHLQAEEYTLSAFETMLTDLIDDHDLHIASNPYELVRRHAHIVHVHKVTVTPTGHYLSGPEPEPTNRVLRRYEAHSDHFVRVVFADDDGGKVRYDQKTDNFRIFDERFKQVFNNGLPVAGKIFSFLGFSHSSLRSQSCWFMAPLFRAGNLAFAEHIIKELGDFTHIRTPAKCAARIGQNFTDTNATVELLPNEIGKLPEVVRNDRTFSDGVGTISSDLLKDVLRKYGSHRMLKPTALQIRFQGAKGMVSLDSRLEGKQLNLRDSMEKFQAKGANTLEICGAGFRPLSMYLNRQLIKILEDLGVKQQAFMDLQAKSTAWLREVTKSSINSATFLENVDIPKSAKLPDLVRSLGYIDLDYHNDSFLYNVVEMAVVHKLRDIKYRARILVDQGLTLYGIMDESGELREGEIFVITEKAPGGGRQILIKDSVAITRSPALHPGDIQIVKAVDVSPSSPLRNLSNVVVFSQYGDRDLPSKLSGGDLDGDQYNIIWDDRLLPATTYPAADYPKVKPIELDRPVTSRDMSDFFLKFMESDLLGVISTLHLALADQSPSGTLDPGCITLAGMASTAVDYSKTGIAVNMEEGPHVGRVRPDFMVRFTEFHHMYVTDFQQAPNPRVCIAEQGYLAFENENKEEDDVFAGVDSEQHPRRYYPSDKALGHLFRAIDERRFLEKLQEDNRAVTACAPKETLIASLLAYMKYWAAQWGIEYTHQLSLAAEIRSSYEDSLLDILYAYEPSPHSPLSEAEVFAGAILGREGGVQSLALRELNRTMRERFDTVVEYTRMRVLKGDGIMREAAADLDALYAESYDERELEALPRAIACLEVAVKQQGYVDRKVGELISFRYVAAGLCLTELERYTITTFGSSSGLPERKQGL